MKYGLEGHYNCANESMSKICNELKFLIGCTGGEESTVYIVKLQYTVHEFNTYACICNKNVLTIVCKK